MSQKINQIALQHYIANFSTKVLNDFYANHEIAAGSDLLEITPLRQINLGIIRRLFESWKAAAQAFRSPYFNFTHEEVRSSLDEFMNVVSQHIAIRKDDLQPLLTESTQDALLLLFAPDEYFEIKLRGLPSFTFTAEHADQLVKYNPIHNSIAQALASRLSESGSESVYANEVLRWLDDTLKNGTALEDTQPYILQFSEVWELIPSKILRNPPPIAEPVLRKQSESKSFFEAALGEKTSPGFAPAIPTAPAPVTDEGSTLAKNSRRTNEDTPSYQEASLNNRFKVDIPEPSDANKYGSVRVKVESIDKSIALGQRFLFINQLFDGNAAEFEQAIKEIDSTHTLETALNMVTKTLASRYNWNPKDEAFIDLLTIVKRKFS